MRDKYGDRGLVARRKSKNFFHLIGNIFNKESYVSVYYYVIVLANQNRTTR